MAGIRRASKKDYEAKVDVYQVRWTNHQTGESGLSSAIYTYKAAVNAAKWANRECAWSEIYHTVEKVEQ